MALKEKQFKICGKPDQPEFIVNFIPEVVDDLEVYSVVNSKKQHCGYVTPELLDFLLTLTDGGGLGYYLNRDFEIKVANDWGEKNKLYQKIILDIPQGTRNQDCYPSLTFTPTEYVRDEPRKALKLTVNKEFAIVNIGGGLEVNFNDNLAEVNKFYFYSTNTAKTTLNIDLAEHKAQSISINELRGSNKNKGNVVFNFVSVGDYYPEISLINSKIEPVEDILNKRFVYPVFKIGGDTFNATQSTVSLPSMLMREDSNSLFEIKSLKGDIILTNSEIKMLEPDNGKSSFLEVKKDINLTTASIIISGAVVINGRIQSSSFPKQHNRTSISFTDSTSQSSLSFKPKNANKCHFIINNSNLDNGAKSIFLRGDVALIGVNFKNDPNKDITFANTTIKYSNLFNVSNIVQSAIYKTHVENFTFKTDSKNDMIFSYGPDLSKKIARTEDDKKITHLLKNTEIELEGADYFRDRVNGSLSITNCVIKGQTTIDSACKKDGKIVNDSYPVSIDNSILKKASIILTKDVDSKVSSVQISNSEIESTLIAHNLEKVDGSLINNSLVSNVLSLNNSVLDSEDIKFDKITELNGYNSTAKAIVDKPKREIGKVTNEMEIL